jgi:hypothetical protein
MNRIKIVMAAVGILLLVGLLASTHGAAARTTALDGNVATSGLAQAATATPDASMMMQETQTPAAMMESATGTPDAGMMMQETVTPSASMMQEPGGTMMNGNLPTTGSSDNSGLWFAFAAALVLLVSGFGLRWMMKASSK